MTRSDKTTNNIFITGATGFLGANLTKRILQDPRNRVFALIRTNLSKKALKMSHRKYVRRIISKPAKKESDRIRFIRGDITEDTLGISKSDLKFLRNNINIVYHSAALRDFNCPLEVIRRVNVKGTENLLKLAVDWKKNGKLRTVNYISTAYIAGDYEKMFFEEQLDVSQKFRNTYEQSKYEAEKVVEKFRKKHLWIDVYRPSVLSDSTNLSNEKLSMLFRFLDLYISGIFSDIPSTNDAALNLIPVDTASEIIYRISSLESREKNRNYHIVNKHPSNIKQMLTLIKKIFSLDKMRITDSWDKDSPGKSVFEKRFMNFLYPYMMQRDSFDMKNTDKYVKMYDITIPAPSKKLFKNILDLYDKKGLIKSTREEHLK